MADGEPRRRLKIGWSVFELEHFTVADRDGEHMLLVERATFTGTKSKATRWIRTEGNPYTHYVILPTYYPEEV